MAKAGIPRKELDRFEKGFNRFISSIATEFVKRAGKVITPEVILAAQRGLGPDDKPYEDWSPAYKKRKKDGSGREKRFLWGLTKKAFSKGGATGHMLDIRNFIWEKVNEFTVQLVWRATGKAADYATVHNEGLGNMPKREWMHLEAKRVLNRIDVLLANIAKDLGAEYNAGKKL